MTGLHSPSIEYIAPRTARTPRAVRGRGELLHAHIPTFQDPRAHCKFFMIPPRNNKTGRRTRARHTAAKFFSRRRQKPDAIHSRSQRELRSRCLKGNEAPGSAQPSNFKHSKKENSHGTRSKYQRRVTRSSAERLSEPESAREQLQQALQRLPR